VEFRIFLSRDWYYEGPAADVARLEEWEKKSNLSRIFEYVIRDWLICGNSLIGISDWEPVQITSVVGVKRDHYGTAEYFVQITSTT
jgi:hypothetical protein